MLQSEPDRLAALFHAAIESQRPREELLRVVLAAALPLAGADLAVVCGPDGEIVAVAPAEDGNVDTTRALATTALRALQRDDHDDDVYVSRLAVDAPYLLALRWARGVRSDVEVAHAVATACSRLLARDEREQPHEVGHDALTGLPSRAAIVRHLDDALHVAARIGTKVGVLFIDLDGFKAVNDTFGHAAGDNALIEAGKRMRESARRGDFVGRLGGDEFIAVLGVRDDEAEVHEAAQRFLDRIAIRVEEEGLVREVGASIGVSVFPSDGADAEALLGHADAAMYAAKRAGGKSVCWYRDGVGQEMNARRELRERLRDADVDRDFLVCYQPIVDAATLRVVGAEALVRWRHPERGWLAPRTFLAGAGRGALNPTIDAWVVDAVAQAAREWYEQGLDVRVHLNLATTDETLCSALEQIALANDGAADRIAVELHEAMALVDLDGMGAFLRRLAALGMKVGLDGFGTEPTSLEALASLPLDFLKIDPRVTHRASHDLAWERVARASIAVAKALGIRPLADGVENRDQARWLAQNGVEELQGYFLAQPMTAPDFGDWLRSTNAVKIPEPL